MNNPPLGAFPDDTPCPRCGTRCMLPSHGDIGIECPHCGWYKTVEQAIAEKAKKCPKCGSETTKDKVAGVTLHYCSNEGCEVNCVETWSALQLCGPEERESRPKPLRRVQTITNMGGAGSFVHALPPRSSHP